MKKRFSILVVSTVIVGITLSLVGMALVSQAAPEPPVARKIVVFQSGIDKPAKESDHALDALRYAVFTHFYGKDSSSVNMKPEDLDKIWRESQGFGNELPHQFNQPSDYGPQVW